MPGYTPPMAAGDSFTSRGGSRPDPSPNGIPTAVHVLVLNAGSSSLKYGFFRVLSRTTNRLVASGVVECIGQALGTAKYKVLTLFLHLFHLTYPPNICHTPRDPYRSTKPLK
jgi:hypothetical protein